MKAFPIFVTLVFTSFTQALIGQTNLESIRRMEASGDTAGARTALARAVEANPNNMPTVAAYAEFLERYGDPGSREAYAKLLTAARNSGDNAQAGAAAHRLALLDLLSGDSAKVSADLDAYKAATGKTLSLTAAKAAAESWPTA